MRDLRSHIAAVALLNATEAADANGHIDRSGYNSLALLIGVGVGGITFDAANKIEFVVEHADDDGSGSPGAYSAVDAGDLNGPDVPDVVTGGIVLALTSAHAAISNSLIGYVGGKQHIRVTANFSGTHGTGTPISVTAILGNPENGPTP